MIDLTALGWEWDPIRKWWEKDGKCIHQVDGGWVISDHETWIPGHFDTLDDARKALEAV